MTWQFLGDYGRANFGVQQLCSNGYLCIDGDYDQTVTIGSNDYVLDFCWWLIQMLYSVGDHMVLGFIF